MKLIKLQLSDIMDHKKFNVGWLYTIASIDRAEGTLLLREVEPKDCERYLENYNSQLSSLEPK